MPKYVDHAKRRTEIIQNARELVGEHGLAALTLRRLADQCGLANGALRRYFAFKDDLLMGLDADLSVRLEQYASRHGYDSQRGIAAVRIVMDAMLPLDAERRHNAGVLAVLRDAAVSNPVFADLYSARFDALFDQIVMHLKQARDDGEIEGTRGVEVTAAILINTVTGICTSSSLGGRRSLANYDAEAVASILDSA